MPTRSSNSRFRRVIVDTCRIGVVLVLLLVWITACAPTNRGARPLPDSSSKSGTGKKDSLVLDDSDLMLLRRIRIYGAGDETSAPILRLAESGKAPTGLGADALTLELDVQCSGIPNPVLVLIHCDRNWKPTESIFIQDQMKLRTDNFRVQRAPSTARFYDYTMDITFPQADQNIKIEHSGNYLARVVDFYHRDKVIGEAKFFVVEPKASVLLNPVSDFFESGQTHVVQRGLRIWATAKPLLDLFGGEFTAINLVRDAHWQTPVVADENSNNEERRKGNVWTVWNSFYGGEATAQFFNVPAGNEYRLLDLTDLAQYPGAGTVVSSALSDLPRGGLGIYDYNGVSRPILVNTRDDDYLLYEFRLDLKASEVHQDIFVVGTFNNWKPKREWQLVYDKATGFYKARGWIKRAIHEYEYVAGTWDDDQQKLLNAESTLLEGNISQSTHSFVGFAYYHDPKLGGFDRIVGVGRSEGSYW